MAVALPDPGARPEDAPAIPVLIPKSEEAGVARVPAGVKASAGTRNEYLLGKPSELLEKGSAKYPLLKIETPR